MQKKWIYPSAVNDEGIRELANYSPSVQQVLFNRGIRSSQAAWSFFEPKWISYDPFLLKTMSTACERIQRAILRKEKIAIYGDYDVDGVTATALLIEVIKTLGGCVIGYIPNRYDDGYGLNIEALNVLNNAGVSLVISVDCGVRSPVEAEHCKKIGLDLIISDHHLPQGDSPDAIALINPKQDGDEYPFKDLAGVGLAYKISQALITHFPAMNIQIEQWLDFVALGTVADVVPLVDENRSMVKKGMELLKKSCRPGIQALKNVSGVTSDYFNSFSIGFLMAPRLNAAGRLESALAALNLLLEEDLLSAGKLASQLDKQNKERQELTRTIQDTAEASILAEEIPYLLFTSNAAFLQGVVGLAASRLVERFYRPSIVAHKGDTQTKGSCRSIPEFHITKALDACTDLLVRHGGHAMAAGFTVDNGKVEELVGRLQEIARLELERVELIPKLKIDALVKFCELDISLMEWVERFQPTGSENAEPVFAVKNVQVIEKRIVGRDGSHLKIRVADADGLVMNAICFRMGNQISTIPNSIDMAFNIEKDFFNGQLNDSGRKTCKLQLNVRDIIPAAG